MLNLAPLGATDLQTLAPPRSVTCVVARIPDQIRNTTYQSAGVTSPLSIIIVVNCTPLVVAPTHQRHNSYENPVRPIGCIQYDPAVPYSSPV